MNWQDAVTIGLVLVAIGYLSWSGWRVLATKKGGCGGGCSSTCSSPAEGSANSQLVSVDALLSQSPRGRAATTAAKPASTQGVANGSPQDGRTSAEHDSTLANRPATS